MTDQAPLIVNLGGRDIAFRQPIPGQLIILRRRMLRLQQEAAAAADEQTQLILGSQLIVDVLDVVESLVIDKADVEFLEKAMLQGMATHEEVMAVIGMKPDEPKPARKRASKASPAKAATRGRTKR